MGFLGYLLMGGIVYTIGFFINLKRLHPKRQAGAVICVTHPIMIGYLLGCFMSLVCRYCLGDLYYIMMGRIGRLLA